MEKKILLIDDDPDEHLVFMDALKKVPGVFNCAYAECAEEGLALAKTYKPDIIFVDYNMPRVNGLEFLSVLRASVRPGLSRVYIYSTCISDEMNKMAKVLGASGCIEKTTTISTLIRELNAILYPDLLPNYVYFGRGK
ncbi:MAG: response regulator transcription factor [Chitinophagaceae bacterium]|nr:response regulator transcription factor [Chitinophagaceae bacterium]